jgi:hypothetical protein
MMSFRCEYLARQSRDSSTFDGSYQTLGSPLGSPAIIFKIVNDSNMDIDISVDGSQDHDFVPANGFVLYDLRTNRRKDQQFAFIQGTQFYVRGSAPGTGNIYLVAMRERP